MSYTTLTEAVSKAQAGQTILCYGTSSGTESNYSYTILDPMETAYCPYPLWYNRSIHWAEKDVNRDKILELEKKLQKILDEAINQEVDIMFLYRVYLIYAADRKNPQIVTTGSTIAKDDEDAKIKSGVYAKIDASWDAEYVTIVAEKVAEVKVKPKPQEVKSV